MFLLLISLLLHRFHVVTAPASAAVVVVVVVVVVVNDHFNIEAFTTISITRYSDRNSKTHS